jgi:hypothetical protein
MRKILIITDKNEHLSYNSSKEVERDLGIRSQNVSIHIKTTKEFGALRRGDFKNYKFYYDE